MCIIQFYSSEISISFFFFLLIKRECPRGVMVKALDSRIIVLDFELQSHCYVEFQTNTLGTGMNPVIHPSTVLLKNWVDLALNNLRRLICHEITNKSCE